MLTFTIQPSSLPSLPEAFEAIIMEDGVEVERSSPNLRTERGAAHWAKAVITEIQEERASLDMDLQDAARLA